MRNVIWLLVLASLSTVTRAQTGSFNISVTKEDGKTIVVTGSMPVYKFNSTHGYWFTNPHNGDRHFNLQPEPGMGDADAAYFTINQPTIDDIDLYDGDDQNTVTFQKKGYFISVPRKGSPSLHLHFTTFTASEIAFTISGMARYGTTAGNGQWVGVGKIEGKVHIYREPQYDQSEKMPGCDCDPTIYATIYDGENLIRTTSACEMALKNKIFDAVQKSLAPVYANMEYHGTQHPIPDGAITIVTMPGHIDVSGPAKQRPYCSTDYRTNTLTGLNAQSALYHDEDSYGIRLLKPASKDELGASGGTNSKAFMQRYMSFADSITKLMGAKKISAEQASKALKDFSANANTAAPDVKKMEVEHNLRITVSLNPEDHELMLVKLGDKNNSVVQHAVKGASFEVFTGEVKDSDGDWIPNREVVYMGNFTTPVRGKSGGGFDAFVTDIQYPAKANKLSVYAITVRLEGGKEMLDKALNTIDFAALQALITK